MLGRDGPVIGLVPVATPSIQKYRRKPKYRNDIYLGFASSSCFLLPFLFSGINLRLSPWIHKQHGSVFCQLDYTRRLFSLWRNVSAYSQRHENSPAGCTLPLIRRGCNDITDAATYARPVQPSSITVDVLFSAPLGIHPDAISSDAALASNRSKQIRIYRGSASRKADLG